MENTDNEKAQRNSTVVEFYERCCKSADVHRPFNTLNPITQQQFTKAVSYIHQVVYHGG
jgi:hypothetical protein